MTTSAETPIRVFLIDDHAMVRSGLRLLIESVPTLLVVGEASSRSEALAAVAGARPDIVLLDLDLGGEDGLDLIPSLIDSVPQARVLLLTGARDTELHRRGVMLGAMGVVLKEERGEIIIKAIEKVHTGEIWLDRITTANLVMDLTRRRRESEPDVGAKLTERERQIVALVGEGLKNKQIAERLFISETTVSHHLTSIFAKLAVPDRLSLVFFAYRNGLAKPPF